MWSNYKFNFYSFLMTKSKRDLVELIKAHEHNLKNIAKENMWLHSALDRAMEHICDECKDRKAGVENCPECIYLKRHTEEGHDDSL